MRPGAAAGRLPLDEFHEGLAGTARVEEGHQVASCAGAGLLIDELVPLGGEAGQLRSDVGGAVRDVMEAGATTVQEACDGGVGGEGLEELQLTHEDNADSLGGEFLHRGTRGTAQAFVKGPGLLDGGDGDGDMIDNQTIHGHFQDRERPTTAPRGRA